MADITLDLLDAPNPDLVDLIGALNDELGALYSPEQRHGLALDALFQPHIRFFIARQGGEAVGCGGVALFDGFGEAKRMYVRPEARGQGAADALMDRLAAETLASGRAVLRLETGIHQHAAIGFYRRHGFGDCPAFAPYTDMPPDAVVTSVFMEKRLLPPRAPPP